MKTTLFAAALAASTLAGASLAFAETTATATTDLNMRAGPGPQYQTTGLIPVGQSVVVNGCLDNSRWCQVSANGATGWAYSQYLTADYQGQTVVIEQSRAEIGLPVVTYQPDPNVKVIDAQTGGELIGPVDGSAPGDFPPPPDTIRTYVVQNQVDPVYLDGEVVVGAGVPDTVELRPVPDYQYDYVYVNNQPVLVDPNTRRIVYVYR